MGAFERFTLRVPPVMMGRMRELARRHHRSLHGEYLQAVQAYLMAQAPAGRTGAMRWVMDGTEYNTEDAEEIANGGTRSRYEEPTSVLYRTAGGEFFMVDDLTDRAGTEITVLNPRDAWQVYLSMPVRIVDEEDAFPRAEGDADEE